MHEYMTRHMVALQSFTYAEWPLQPGDAFRATPDDAGYLTRCGKAKAEVPSAGATAQGLVQPAPQAAHVPPQVAQPEPEPVAQPVTEAPVVTAEASKPDDTPEPAAEANAEPPQDAVAPTSRRRGRLTNAELAARRAAEAGDGQAEGQA